jgi:hypothetical protein
MTPKEKAQELVDKFKIFVIGRNDSVIEKQNAKRCALIAVDEIIESDWFIPTLRDKHEWTSYWNEVKTEIEKL